MKSLVVVERGHVVPLLLLASLLVAVPAEAGRCVDVVLATTEESCSPFDSPFALERDRVRFFPSDTLSLDLRVAFRDLASVPSTAALAEALELRLIPGDVRQTLESGAGTPVGLPAMTWLKQPAAACAFDACVRLTVTGVSAPPGLYSLVVVSHEPSLKAECGPLAPANLRSNRILLVTGPPATDGDELWQLLRAGHVAMETQSYAAAASHASELLARYPSSVLALCLRAEAREGLGDASGALLDYGQAKQLLMEGSDTRTAKWKVKGIRESYMDALTNAIADLESQR